MSPRFNRDRFTWLVYFLMAFFGYFMNILGPITPFLKSELKLTYTVSSLHFSAFALGILVVGLGGHLVIVRLGRWHSLWVGAIGMSLSALLLIFGKTPQETIGASFLMGLVGSLILAIVPAALSEKHGQQRAIAISESNVISSLVAMAAPLLVGWLARLAGDWRLALGIVATAPIFLYFGLGRGLSLVDASFEHDSQPAGQTLSALFWFYWVAIVLAVSVEFCMISWSGDFLENVLKMQKIDAAQSVSLFFAAMIVGRYAGSRLVQKIASSKLVEISIFIASLGFLLFWKAGSIYLGLAGLFLTGLGVASLYPLLLSLAMGAAGKNTVQASARTTLASGAAVLTLPLILGRLADSVGIELAYGVIVFLLVAVFVIVQVSTKKIPSNQLLG